MSYDVIVIGGGLAGLSLSIDLSQRGHKVAVIEKGSYPRHKVCGEYISMESYRYLSAICPAIKELDLPEIKKFRLTSTSKNEFTTDLGMGGFGISRFLLEDLLYKQALELNVTFMLDTKATTINYDQDRKLYAVQTKSQILNASVVCNSSGRRSNLEMSERGQKDQKANYVGVKYHVRLKRDPEQIEIHNFPGGYCGISNIEEDRACLCYIVNAKELAAANKSIPELERKILSQNKNLYKIFTEAEFLFKEPVTISGINFLIKEPINKTTFFLGDSAGSIAPVTGNGMSMALRSAYVLANNLDLLLKGKWTRAESEKEYSAFWNKEFSNRIVLSRYFQRLSEYPSLTKMTIGIFNVFPPLAKGIINLTHGKYF